MLKKQVGIFPGSSILTNFNDHILFNSNLVKNKNSNFASPRTLLYSHILNSQNTHNKIHYLPKRKKTIFFINRVKLFLNMMMNKNVLSSILFFMLIGSVLVESRPLGLTKTEEKFVASLFDGLSLGSIKDSGPSPGEGHKVVDRKDTFRFVKHSGPSPSGPGH